MDLRHMAEPAAGVGLVFAVNHFSRHFRSLFFTMVLFHVYSEAIMEILGIDEDLAPVLSESFCSLSYQISLYQLHWV